MNRKLKNEELNRLTVDDFKRISKIPVILVLDNIRSLSNIGSIFRTADAFLVQEIVLCGITARPPHREIRKTALGATESVQWSYKEKTIDAVAELQEKGYEVLAIEQTEKSIPLHKLKLAPERPYAFVFGHEVFGVDQNVIDHCNSTIEIPQFGTKHSLNVSITAGIVLWDVFGKLEEKPSS